MKHNVVRGVVAAAVGACLMAMATPALAFCIWWCENDPCQPEEWWWTCGFF